jgi:hypothetical protein
MQTIGNAFQNLTKNCRKFDEMIGQLPGNVLRICAGSQIISTLIFYSTICYDINFGLIQQNCEPSLTIFLINGIEFA